LLHAPPGSGPTTPPDDTVVDTAPPDSGGDSDAPATDTGDTAVEVPCASGWPGAPVALPLSLPDDGDGEVNNVEREFGVEVAAWANAGTNLVAVTGGGVMPYPSDDARGGLYALDGSAWSEPLLPTTTTPILRAEGVPAVLVAVGSTTLYESPREATWLESTIEGPDGDPLHETWLFSSMPVAPATTDDATAYFQADRGGSNGHFDCDGDGLDDYFVMDYEPKIYLAPMSGTYDPEDADVTFAQYLHGEAAVFHPEDHAALDLDGDGYLDLVWQHAVRLGDGSYESGYALKRGPLATRPAWTSYEGVLLIDLNTRSNELTTNSALTRNNLAVVGDITGDGVPDATLPFYSVDDGDANSHELFVLDRWIEGTESLSVLGNRLVGAPGEGEAVQLGALGASGGGDFDGDGQGDLVVFQYFTRLATGPIHRVYALPGPITGIVDLASAAHVIEPPCLSEDCYYESLTVATLVPDITGDGFDDTLVSVYSTHSHADLRSILWLYPGCDDW
jgi:hypothetical protein